MVKINLDNGYFIVIDEYNHTVKQKYMTKGTKKTKPRESERVLGYYSNIRNCVKRVISHMQATNDSETVISMDEFAERVERACNSVCERIEVEING